MNSGAYAEVQVREADPALVEQVLERLASSRMLPHRFLCAAVERPVDPKEWKEAIAAVLVLASSPSRKRGTRARELKPRFIQTLQGIAGLGAWLPLEWLEVLVYDASEASLDALVPQVALAHQAGDERLDQLAEMLTTAAVPSLEPLREQVQRHLEERSARLFGELAVALGLERTARVAFNVRLESTQNNRIGLVARIEADSMTGSPLAVQLEVTTGGRPRNVLPVGRITPAELPAKLAEVATQHGVMWDRTPAQVTGGNIVTAPLVTWLLGKSASAR